MYCSRGFFDTLSQEFGNEVRLIVKEWAAKTRKLANLHNRKIFLLKCKESQLIPNHIVNNVKCIWSLQCEFNPFVNEAERILSKFRMSTLKLEIRITLWKLNKLENRVYQIKLQLQELLPASVFVRCCGINHSRFNLQFCKVRDINIRKLSKLQLNNHEVITQGQQHKVLHTISRISSYRIIVLEY